MSQNIYYIALSSFLPPPERGTFASVDIPMDTNVGLGVQFNNRYIRPDIEWHRSELCRFINHSEHPNLRQHVVRTDTETTVYFYACRDIKQDDELTINYKDFPYKQAIDLTFLDPRNKMHFLYMVIPTKEYDLFRERGYLSPMRIYEESPAEFDKVVRKYRNAAAGYLSRDVHDITDCDVMTYLMAADKSEFWLTQYTIYFNLLSVRWYPDKFLKNTAPFVEVAIDYLKLLCYNPVLLDPTEFSPKSMDWDTLMRGDTLDDIRQSALLCSDLNKKLCMPRIAIPDLYHINSDLFELTTYEHGAVSNGN